MFYDFFKIFFKNLDFIKFQYVEDLSPVVGFCEFALRGCESLPLIMAAQILVVFEI